MIFLWILFFTLIVLVHSFPQSADNVDPQPVVNSDSSIAFQDALADDKSSDALPPSQNPPFSDIDFSQDSIVAETGLSQDATTAETDRSQPELVAETDSSGIPMADCTSAAPTDDLSDENNQILARDNHRSYCPTEPIVPPLTKPNSPSPKPQNPENEPSTYPPSPSRAKPKLRSDPVISPEKPTLRTKPSDNDNPCPVRDGKHLGRKIHVTCGGPEAEIAGTFSSESRWVVNCVLKSQSIIYKRSIFPETDKVAEYCCHQFHPSGPAYASSWCTKIKALYHIERIDLKTFRKLYQRNTPSFRDYSGEDTSHQRPKNP